MVAHDQHKTQAVATTEAAIPDEVAKEIGSWAEAEAYFAGKGIAVSFGEEISDGFEKVSDEDKTKFVKVPILILDWERMPGDMGMFATIRFITQEGKRYRMSDGSTGIYDQLTRIEVEREKLGHPAPTQGLAVRRGLRKSEYWVSKASKQVIPREDLGAVPEDERFKGATYYLDF